MGKRILMRVDADRHIGLGHFFRSVDLANTLSQRGHEVVFIHLPSDFWYSRKDFRFESITAVADEIDARTMQYITDSNADVFYVDGMIEFEEHFIDKLKTTCEVVFYQNLTDSKRYADVYILPSIHQGNDFFSDFTETTKVYSGLKYATFNPILKDLKRRGPEDTAEFKKIAVCAGGSDPFDVLRKVYRHIESLAIKHIDFTFYYGESYVFLNDLPQENENMRFRQFDFGSILQADAMITAFGVSAYEFMYLGLPVLSVGYNERHNIASEVTAEKTRAFIHLGLIDNLMSKDFEKGIDALALQECRKKIIQTAQGLIDLEGVIRVAEIIEKN